MYFYLKSGYPGGGASSHELYNIGVGLLNNAMVHTKYLCIMDSDEKIF